MWKDAVGAKRELSLRIKQLPLNLHNPFMRSLYGLVFFFGNVERWQLLRQFRPEGPLRGQARVWWQFAIRCTLKGINRTRLGYESVSKAVHEGTEYVGLWMRKSGQGRPWVVPLGKQELERLQHLEDVFPVDVTKTYRERAWLAVGETVILMHPPLPLLGVAIGIKRGCQ